MKREFLPPSLTERELAVLKLVAEGLSNKQIADRLFISAHTTKAHLESIFQKFNVNNRLQAVLKALSENFFEINDIVIPKK